MKIKKGDKVKVEYEGTLDNGTVFDSSAKHHKLLEFEVGSQQVIKGFDDALMGMEPGQEKMIDLTPANAYGDHNPQLVKKVPRDQLPKEQEPQKGMTLVVGMPNGSQLPAKITEVTPDMVTIDFNHALAGKNLHFKIKVVEVAS